MYCNGVINNIHVISSMFWWNEDKFSIGYLDSENIKLSASIQESPHSKFSVSSQMIKLESIIHLKNMLKMYLLSTSHIHITPLPALFQVIRQNCQVTR